MTDHKSRAPDAMMRPALSTLTDELGLLYGGDYNPEQWDRETWLEDARLMQAAGVNLVTVGVFSWALLEPRPGERSFGWLDEVLDLLHAHGIAVDLATPTASPPPWMGHLYPETLPVDRDGVRLTYGSRNQFSPSSEVYRGFARDITRDLVDRYVEHPAVRMWHVGNELGQVCHSDATALAFRTWLDERYGSLDGLNEAWGTTFWSQRYSRWEEVVPPRRAPYLINPTQELDFRRFTSDALRAVYREQRDIIRERDPRRPVTTNFMGFFPLVDYWSWAQDLDVVSDDAYPDPVDPTSLASAALTQDLMRSLGGGAPWLLMEQAVSAVNWRDHNVPKTPARMRLESLQAVAHGADGVCFFQWRASRAGAERFHSAMLPHAGADTDVHRGVVGLGADLARLRPVVGGRSRATVAIAFDWSSWWAAEGEAGPTRRLRVVDEVRRWHRALWERGVAVDLVRPGDALGEYDLVLAPNLYLLDEPDAANLRAFVAGGGTLVLGPFSDVATRDAHVRPGRFPVQLADLVGASGEEWLPLDDDGLDVVSDLWAGPDGVLPGIAHLDSYVERLRLDGADGTDGTEGAQAADGADGSGTTAEVAEAVVVASSSAPAGLSGAPVVVRRRSGAGRAWYVGALLPDAALDAVLAEVLRESGTLSALGTPAARLGVEAVRRGDLLFLLNHTGSPVSVPVGSTPLTDLLTSAVHSGSAVVPPVDVLVLTERPS